jgi:hypothetical protein
MNPLEVIYVWPNGKREMHFMQFVPHIGYQVEFNDERYVVASVRECHQSESTGNLKTTEVWHVQYLVFMHPSPYAP